MRRHAVHDLSSAVPSKPSPPPASHCIHSDTLTNTCTVGPLRRMRAQRSRSRWQPTKPYEAKSRRKTTHCTSYRTSEIHTIHTMSLFSFQFCFSLMITSSFYVTFTSFLDTHHSVFVSLPSTRCSVLICSVWFHPVAALLSAAPVSSAWIICQIMRVFMSERIKTTGGIRVHAFMWMWVSCVSRSVVFAYVGSWCAVLIKAAYWLIVCRRRDHFGPWH